MAERLEGKIKRLEENGFGFIEYKDKDKYKDIYFHHTALKLAKIVFKSLNVGDEVSFSIGDGVKPGLIAAHDIRLEKRSVPRKQPQPEAPRPVQATTATETTTKLPYVHVPLQENESILGEPVPHNSPEEKLISGTLSLELEVLTPLLMANYQFTYDQLPKYYQDLLPEDFKELMSSEQNKSARQKKKFLIPNYVEITTEANQAQQKERRLVLPGKSIRNVLRRSLIALCQAPFERVAKRDYTRVPNLQANGKKTKNQAAYITAIEGETLKVQLVKEVCFLDEKATNFFKANKSPFGKELDNPKGYRLENHPYRPKIFSADTNQLEGKWVPALYNGGSDGIGELAAAHKDVKKAFVHSVVFLPADELKSPPIDIDSAVYDRYQEEQKFLAKRIDEHPLRAKLGDAKAKGIKEKIEEFQTLKVGQLIYVELDEASNQIIRIGRHYYYKTRTKHSLKEVNNQLRKVFEPHSAEITVKDHTQMPSLLTAARLLMGYVHDDDTQHIAAGPWQHYKGRIAVVDAVAQDEVTQGDYKFPPKKGTNVFSWLQLNVALGPKGSQVRLLDQSNGLASFEHENTTFNGYPFYRHVSAESVDAQLQTLQQQEFYNNDLAPIGFDVCHTGIFKTTVTFSKLRDWELGVLLCVLEPHHLLIGSRALSEGKQFAHKLGYGKSIGMGCVALRVNTIEQFVDIERLVNGKFRKIPDVIKLDQTKYVDAFIAKLAEAKIDYQPWLAVHLFDANDNAQLRYPAITSYQAWNKTLASEQRGAELKNEKNITAPFITKASAQEL